MHHTKNTLIHNISNCYNYTKHIGYTYIFIINRPTAIFLTSKSCNVAEQTIICLRLPSGVKVGIRPWSLFMKSLYPCFRSPSASSRTKNLHWERSKYPADISSSSLPGVPTTTSTWPNKINFKIKHMIWPMQISFKLIYNDELIFYVWLFLQDSLNSSRSSVDSCSCFP